MTVDERELRRRLERAADDVAGSGDADATWHRAAHRAHQLRRRRRAASAAAGLLLVGVVAAATVPQVTDLGRTGAPEVAEDAAGTGGPAERDDAPRPTAAPDPQDDRGQPDAVPEAAPTEGCVDEQHGFAIAHPAGWHAAEDGCGRFGPEPLDGDEAIGGGHVPGVRVVASVADFGFDRYVHQAVGGRAVEEVVDRDERTVDGQRALRWEAVASGEAGHVAGTRLTTWAIELDEERVLVLQTTDVEGDYARNVGVLDAMAETVRPLQDG